MERLLEWIITVYIEIHRWDCQFEYDYPLPFLFYIIFVVLIVVNIWWRSP